jgi:hypothetical protein
MSEMIVGIDLGTTNSEIAVYRDGRPVVQADEAGRLILPSVVGLDQGGGLLVGEAARNQAHPSSRAHGALDQAADGQRPQGLAHPARVVQLGDLNPQLGFTVKITLVQRRDFASSTVIWETDFRGTETRGCIRGQGATTPLKWPPQTTL